MANFIIKNTPNTITCCNLMSGCIATGCAFHGHFFWAVIWIVIGAVFDFFDGMSARALGVSSPIGKELDSLADIVTFGVAPSAILFCLFRQVHYPEILIPLKDFIPYTAFIMAAFSALRLAKFNLDERQSTQFIGLPTPANALFWGSLVLGQHAFLVSQKFNAVFLFLFMLLFCMLLVSEVPMLALKFKDLSWEKNKVKFIFIFGCLPCFLLGASCFAAIILWYVALSIITDVMARRSQNL
ncbi:MAG: CDP-diacylglycerol--serine O-phosphatidyltransferase [Bacteroidaceae bacterium]|nr:CDP-diacylglycerol--serine O-phosphatidyltransferase [Bacteroidaceae bacterium]